MVKCNIAHQAMEVNRVPFVSINIVILFSRGLRFVSIKHSAHWFFFKFVRVGSNIFCSMQFSLEESYICLYLDKCGKVWDALQVWGISIHVCVFLTFVTIIFKLYSNWEFRSTLVFDIFWFDFHVRCGTLFYSLIWKWNAYSFVL